MIALPKSISASRLRLILSAALLLIVVGGVGVFYLGYTNLSKVATDTGEEVASAQRSENTIQRLETLKKELEAKKDIVFMTSQVTANSENYAYQDRLVQDLTIYANRANVNIKNISFTSSASSSSTPAPPANTDESSAPTEGGPPQVGGTNLKKATVDITLESPVNYRNLLNYLHYIEQNLTKLKVSKVTLTKGESEDVTIDVLNLEVYLQ